MMKTNVKFVNIGLPLKVLLLLMAAGVAMISLFYTDNLVAKLKDQEKKRVELWADAYNNLMHTDLDESVCPLVLKIISTNHYIPVIMTDQRGKIISYANLDSTKIADSAYLYRELALMKAENKPIKVIIDDDLADYIYYRDSYILRMLRNFPILQTILVFLFLLITYFLFVIMKSAEDNLLWSAMSKETAHQLGTPVSALMAWVEMLNMRDEKDPMLDEIKKDVKSLEMITERFSSIGAKPKLVRADVVEIVQETIQYLKPRVSSKVNFYFFSELDRYDLNLNPLLFRWVIENLGKNAIDAVSGRGDIFFRITKQNRRIFIDVKDTGKGISKRNFKRIFKPGYTTKRHGWGLGLVLVKRIIEKYHNGKIYVLFSEVGKGTTIRIELPT